MLCLQEELPGAAAVAVAAAGLLQAVGQATSSLATWRDATQAFAAPTSLAVLVAVAQAQPQLHAQVSSSITHATRIQRRADVLLPLAHCCWCSQCSPCCGG